MNNNLPKPQAFLFDLNGTMVDDMDYHTTAWHAIITGELKVNMSREEVKKHMYGKNEEVLTRILGEGAMPLEEMKMLGDEKERQYRIAFKPDLKLIAGLDQFLEKAATNRIKIGLGTAAIVPNVDFVLDGLNIRHYFSAIVTADDVRRSKPDPETFASLAEKLNVDASACVVFEDSPKGVECALNNGMSCVVIKTLHDEADFSHLPNIRFFITDYQDPRLQALFP